MEIKETNTYKKLKNLPTNNFPEFIVVHHSGGTDLNPLEDTSNHTAQMMEAYHLSLGWDGLGYQYVIHKNGEIWRGRPEHRNGAHTKDQNAKSIGICLSGNFDATLPTKEQINALKWLIDAIKARYTVIGDKIYPHRKFANKTCYGKLLSDTWAKDLVIASLPIPPTLEQKKAEIIKLIQNL